jgi:hypothetical protein
MSSHTTSVWRERLASPVIWHAIAFTVLFLLVVWLAVRFGLDWSATNDRSTGAMAEKQLQLKALELEIAPLKGLDKRVEESRGQIKTFYGKRIPPSYSAIASRVGELQVKAGVRLARVQYSQGPGGTDLTRISMDAGISGDYPQIMRFVNSLERDQTFFVIQGMQLTGQQGGLVNLRLQVSTWLRPADAAASGLPPTPEPAKDASGSASAAKEGE